MVIFWASLVLSSKESACNAGDAGLIPGLGRSPREGNGNPLQYSCLGNSMDEGAWQATVHGDISFCFTPFIRSITRSSPYSKGSYYTEHESQEVEVMETIYKFSMTPSPRGGSYFWQLSLNYFLFLQLQITTCVIIALILNPLSLKSVVYFSSLSMER